VRRIRIVFLLLGILLLLPLLLLVQRALEGVAREREVSHRAVAERLFDEMERELSSLLRAEEERPFENYRAAGKATAAAGGRRSDTGATDADPSYVVGYFQIDPDGNFEAPSPAATPPPAGGAPAAPKKQAKTESVREFEALVERGLVAEAKSKRESGEGVARAAESSVVVGGSLRDNADAFDEVDALAEAPAREAAPEAFAMAEAVPQAGARGAPAGGGG
jgi:hypothetical protein